MDECLHECMLIVEYHSLFFINTVKSGNTNFKQGIELGKKVEMLGILLQII